MSWRRVRTLIASLPHGSATRNAVVGETEDWTLTDHLTVELIDAVNILAWITVQANSKKNVPRPEPARRPGTPTRRSTLSSPEIERRLLEQRKG